MSQTFFGNPKNRFSRVETNILFTILVDVNFPEIQLEFLLVFCNVGNEFLKVNLTVFISIVLQEFLQCNTRELQVP